MEVIIEAGGRVVSLSQLTLTFDNTVYIVEVKGNTVVVNGHQYTVTENGSVITVDAIPFAVEFRAGHVMVNGIQHTYHMGVPPLQKLVKKSVPGSGAITAIMPGRIIAVSVKEGDTVQEGDVICILEAMKMENEIRATRGGKVRNIAVKPGVIVEKDQVLVEIE